MSEKRYSQRTVINAQRRVLTLALGFIGKMPRKELMKLRTDGSGLMTLNEVAEHIVAALHLKVKWRAISHARRR